MYSNNFKVIRINIPVYEKPFIIFLWFIHFININQKHFKCLNKISKTFKISPPIIKISIRILPKRTNEFNIYCYHKPVE